MVDIFDDDDARETCWDIVPSDTTGPELSLAEQISAALRLCRSSGSFVAWRPH
jgi:hypothetical protein